MKKKGSKKRMGTKTEKIKRFGQEMGKTLKKIGASGEDILKKIEKSDKEMNEKMEKILNSANL